jgi:DNA-directed RNA polymerase specialized sigma24 family protein
VAERLQQDPTLGIGPEEPATKLATQIQLFIIRNLDNWRHKRAREKRRLSAMPVEELAQESPYSVSDILEINAAVDALNADQRDVFGMRFFRYHRSYVAHELDLSVSQVDRRNSAAKEKLRRELRDYRFD